MFEHLPPYLLLGLATVVGFYVGKMVRLTRLPSLLGYMLVGLLMGPSLAGLFHKAQLEHYYFINELALGLVAFTIGSELSFQSLKRQGLGIVSIILSESFGAFLAVLGGMAALTYWQSGSANWPLALVFASMAPASAPAGTVAIIQEYKAKGSLTSALYAVVGFDDGLAILIFGFASSLAIAMLRSQLPGVAEVSLLATMWAPLVEIGESLGIGVVLGYSYCFLLRKLQHKGEVFVLTLGFVFLAVGLSDMLHMSLILTNLVIGFVLVNTRTEDLVHRVGDQLQPVMPLVFILFFCMAGAHLDLAALVDLGLVGVVYIIARSAGLVGGSRLGGLLGSVEEAVRRWVGLGILSQAGVAIGLSLIVQSEFAAIAAEFAAAGMAEMGRDVAAMGTAVITTVTATCVFFEVVGPITAKFALSRAGEIPTE